MHKHEASSMLAFGIILRGEGIVGLHCFIVLFQVRGIGFRIDRVLQMPASTRYHLVLRIAQQLGITALWVFLYDQIFVAKRLVFQSHTSAHQEEMIICIVHLLVLGIIFHQTGQCLASKGIIAQLLMLQHTSHQEGITQELMRGLHLLLCHGYLFQIKGLVARVVLQRIHVLLSLIAIVYLYVIFALFQLGYAFWQFSIHGKSALVCPSPVVGILSLAPLAEEGILALLHRIGIAEIPSLLGITARLLPIGHSRILLGLCLGIGLLG